MRHRTWFAYAVPFIFLGIYVWEIRTSNDLLPGLVSGFVFMLTWCAVFLLACYHLWHRNWFKGIWGLALCALLAVVYFLATSTTEPRDPNGL